MSLLPEELRLYRLLQLGLTRDEALNGSAVENDWLLAIHQLEQRVQHDRAPQTTPHDRVVTRPLGPPGG